MEKPSIHPHVSVVIPCRNEVDAILGCLTSVLGQVPPEGGMEVIVADGMSEDGTREILDRVATAHSPVVTSPAPPSSILRPLAFIPCPPAACGPVVRLIDNPGRIASTGLNAAIRASKGDIIIRMDAHTEFAPDYVRSCVTILVATGADNVGGPARTKPTRYLERAIAAAYHSPFSVGGARFHNVDYEGFVDTVTYGCWRKESFARFGYFDEELVRNQDDEHNLRIVRGGGKVWQSPAIKSWYRPRASLRALFNQYTQYGYWKVRVIQKHKMTASIRHLVPGVFLLFLITTAVCSLFSHLASVSFLGAVTIYCLSVSLASLITAARTGWNLLPVLPLAFPCYHFGYAYGFLRGAWDFAILRRRPNSGFQLLTR